MQHGRTSSGPEHHEFNSVEIKSHTCLKLNTPKGWSEFLFIKLLLKKVGLKRERCTFPVLIINLRRSFHVYKSWLIAFVRLKRALQFYFMEKQLQREKCSKRCAEVENSAPSQSQQEFLTYVRAGTQHRNHCWHLCSGCFARLLFAPRLRHLSCYTALKNKRWEPDIIADHPNYNLFIQWL